MKLVLKIGLLLIAVVILIGAGGYAWTSINAGRILAQTYTAHEVDFPIPFPLDPAEIGELALAPVTSARASTRAS